MDLACAQQSNPLASLVSLKCDLSQSTAQDGDLRGGGSGMDLGCRSVWPHSVVHNNPFFYLNIYGDRSLVEVVLAEEEAKRLNRQNGAESRLTSKEGL